MNINAAYSVKLSQGIDLNDSKKTDPSSPMEKRTGKKPKNGSVINTLGTAAQKRLIRTLGPYSLNAHTTVKINSITEAIKPLSVVLAVAGIGLIANSTEDNLIDFKMDFSISKSNSTPKDLKVQANDKTN